MSKFVIIDEQPDFIVVDKAENTNFHDEGALGQGLFNVVSKQFSEKIYPVHRLDKMTSGLVIFAKSLAAAQQFQQAFEQHHIEKYYLAISDTKPKKKQGLVKGDMSKSRRGMYKLLRTTKNPATTQFFSYGLGNGLRLFLLKPHSGKTHQLRVALNSLGSAILGDPLYQTLTSVNQNAPDRGYLHAYAMRFTLDDKRYQYLCTPTQGQAFTSQICQETIEHLGEPWQISWPKVK